MSKIKRLIRILLFFAELFLAYIVSLFIKAFNKNMRNVWIIAERGDDARDNGYFFYKYIRENHPEQNIYYVIKKSSADFKKVQKLGKTVEYNSFRHYVIYAASKVRLSSSMWGGDLPKASYFSKAKFLLKHKKFVFLKHGIIKDFLPQHSSPFANPDIYICGAKPEYEFVKENFGHPEGVVKYTGLARFDNLNNIKTKNQILVMPTFRKWLQGRDNNEVKNSEYVLKWNAFLNDERVNKLLNDNNLELIFYPHYVMQPYVDLFYSKFDRVKIAKFKDYDVQQLLIESKLLITDFSSVFFDFGYMLKPVIYYHFDRERFIKEHYDFTKGYFSYDDNGFGKVVFDNDLLISETEKAVNSDFTLQKEYKDRIDKFFPLKDDKNCERIFKKILNILES